MVEEGTKTGSLVESLEPIETLYDFDGPKIFTVETSDGGLLLAFFTGVTDKADRFLLVPTNKAEIAALKSGLLPVREALLKPWAWQAVQRWHDGLLTQQPVRVQAESVETLPRPGVLLWPELEPLFVVRAVGDQLRLGTVTASVMKRTLEGATHAVKAAVDWATGDETQSGRPADWIRRLYDLPVQRLAFASFEISFSSPPPQAQADWIERERALLERAATLLSEGLDWAVQGEALTPGDEHTRDAMLDALQKLTPPAHGPIEEIHVSGRLIGSIPRVLTREAAAKVRKAARRVPESRLLRRVGLVRECDKDRLTFILRSDGEVDMPCSFDLLFYDDVLSAFETDEPVQVVARQRGASSAPAEIVAFEPSSLE